jgi:hypothetical protein
MLPKPGSENKGEMMPMKKLAIGFLVLLAFALHGCYGLFEGSEPLKRARETKALSLLRQYQTAATFHQVETGFYGSLPELYEDGSYGAGIINEAFYNAWDGHDQPQPLGGYLYSSIDTDWSGAPLDRMNYAGLCAYPSEPGKTGDLIICALADPEHFQEGMSGDFPAVSHGEEWTFYTAMYVDVGEPLHSWPSDETLEETFQALKKRTPQEGLRDARRLSKGVPKRR